MSILASETQGLAREETIDGLRVMMVDDSVVIRGLVSKWLSQEKEIGKVNTYMNGRYAIEALEKDNPDIVILDIEMPEMDGIEALQKIKELKPDLPVIMASSLTQRNAEISLRALSLGATDYVPKPSSNSGVTTSPEFRRSLVEKTLELGSKAKRSGRGSKAPCQIPNPDVVPHEEDGAAAAPISKNSFSLRDASSMIPRILAIGSSTGGPIALSSVLCKLGPNLDHCPILIAQHMPDTFTAILASQLAQETGRVCAEGQDGEEIRKGQIYVAPGGRHMVLKKDGAVTRISLEDGPPVNFCKPAVDPLFSSVADIYGNTSLALVLTGMGSDGREGAKAVAGRGGTVIAQDEDSSVVWGMPGSVAKANLCSAVLPLDELPTKIIKLMRGMTS